MVSSSRPSRASTFEFAVLCAGLLLLSAILPLFPWGTPTPPALRFPSSPDVGSGQRNPSPVPPTSGTAAHGRPVPVRSTLSTRSSDPPYWSNVSSTGALSPGVTYGSAIAYDPVANTTVFVGGDSPTSLGSYWTYNNFTWSAPSMGIPEDFPGIAYDSSDSELIAFGGGAPVHGEVGTTVPTNATYAFSAGAWVNLTSNLSLSPPSSGAPFMASDPGSEGALLLDPVGPTNGSQTWLFSNGSWENLTATAGTPPPGPAGADSVMAFDPGAGAVVFFGGSFPGPGYAVPTNETWEFEDGRWTDLNITGPSLPAGSEQTMAYDGPIGAMVDLVAPVYLYAENGSPPYQDWEFLGGAWFNETSYLPTTPPIGFDPVSVWDPADGYLLYMTGGAYGQSWTLGATPLSTRLTLSSSLLDEGFVVYLSVTVIGGAPPFRYSYSGLPPGCSTQSEPDLACAPTSPGNFSISVVVQDSYNATASSTANLTVGGPFTATGPLVSPGSFYLGTSVEFSVAVSGGLPPYVYDWDLPVSNCNPPDAPSVRCTVNQLGSTTIEVLVSDRAGNDEPAVSESVSVVNRPSIVTFTPSAPVVEAGSALAWNVNVSGGALPLTFAYSGLPGGCTSMNTSNLTCHPSASGTFNVSVQVTDALGGIVRASVGVTVVAALAISAEEISPNPAPLGSTVTFNYTVSGGERPFHSVWAGLPPGCVASQAVFSCPMNTSGTFDVELTLRDAFGGVADSNVTLQVPASSGPSGSGSPFSAVPTWGWAIIAFAVLALAAVVMLDRQRRRSTPEPEPPSTEIELDGSELAVAPAPTVVEGDAPEGESEGRAGTPPE